MSTKFYHGTTKELAERILSEQRFLISQNPYDWLGPGVYFYQESPIKALVWAQRFSIDEKSRGSEPAVLEVEIDLSKSFDIFKPENQAVLREVHQKTSGEPVSRQKRPVLRRIDGQRFHVFESRPLDHDRLVGNNFVDAVTVGRALQMMATRCNLRYDCARYFFWEGMEAYAGSYFYDHSNIQLCIIGPDDADGQFYVKFDDPIFLEKPREYVMDPITLESVKLSVRWPI